MHTIGHEVGDAWKHKRILIDIDIPQYLLLCFFYLY